MKRILKYIGISSLVLSIILTISGAFMKINSYAYASLVLNIGMLGFIIPVLIIFILAIFFLAKK
jgi:hypothetical protein